jgi:MFS family permease
VDDLPTRQAFVTEMVGTDQLPNAIGLKSSVLNSARIIGPAIAGIIIDSVGVAPAFLVNAISFVAVIAGLLAMRTDELFSGTLVARGRGQIREGISYVWHNPALRSTLLLITLVATFGFNFIVVLPLLARQTFNGTAGLYGALSAFMALGSVAGALVAAARARASRALLIGSAGVFGILTVLVAGAPNAVTAGALLVPIGAALIVFISTANTTLQLTSSPEMRGRVMAIFGLVFLGSNPLGAPLLGWICQHWGARAGLVFGGSISILAAAVALSIQRRRVPAGATAPTGVQPRIA